MYFQNVLFIEVILIYKPTQVVPSSHLLFEMYFPTSILHNEDVNTMMYVMDRAFGYIHGGWGFGCEYVANRTKIILM